MNSKQTGIFFKWSNPFLPVFIVAVTVFLFVGHPLQAEIPASPITVPDTIIIGSEPDYPPYCILDKNGNPDGFSVELFRAVAHAAGIEVTFKIGAWNVIHTELANGAIDALPIVGFNTEREELFEFSMPYLTLHNTFFVRKGTSGFQSINDLSDKEILVMKEDNAEFFLRREKITDKILTTTSFEGAFKKLESGQHDAVFIQRLTGIKILENMGIRTIEPLNIQSQLLRIDYCFAVQKGNRQLISRLNEGLAIVIANNTYKKIHQKWFGSEEKFKTDTWYYIKIAVLIFVPLAIAMSLLEYASQLTK